MSANLVVDIGNTCISFNSIRTTSLTPASGAVIGEIWDGLHADTFTNLWTQGLLQAGSGQLRVGVQTSDTTASGDFTDPTSGLAAFPTVFESGGFYRLNSGSLGSPVAGQNGLFGAFTSGQAMQSGFMVFGAFQRPHRYARVVVASGDFFIGVFGTGFTAQMRTTGSGGGFTLAPSSGPVNV